MLLGFLLLFGLLSSVLHCWASTCALYVWSIISASSSLVEAKCFCLFASYDGPGCSGVASFMFASWLFSCSSCLDSTGLLWCMVFVFCLALWEPVPSASFVCLFGCAGLLSPLSLFLVVVYVLLCSGWLNWAALFGVVFPLSLGSLFFIFVNACTIDLLVPFFFILIFNSLTFW